MPFTKDEDGGLRFDRSAAGNRWGQNANRPDFVEAAEMFIDRGSIGRVWDTLASPTHRPGDLNDDEERLIVRCALRRSVELGRLNANMVEVLLRLIGGADRLKSERRTDLSVVRAYIKANPQVTLGQLKHNFGTPRSSGAVLKKEVLASND